MTRETKGCSFCGRFKRHGIGCPVKAGERRRRQKAKDKVVKKATGRVVWRVLLETTPRGDEPGESWYDSFEGARDYARIFDAPGCATRVIEITRYVLKRMPLAELARAMLNRAGWCESAVTIPEEEWRTGKRKHGALKVRS